MKNFIQKKGMFLALCLLFIITSTSTLLGQAGQVLSHQEIGEGVGGFTGILQVSELFGFDVDGIGDLDNDGIPDIVAGAPQYSGPVNADDGAVYVLFLHPNGTVKAHQRIGANEGGFTDPLEPAAILGVAATGIGDFDNDGVEDIVMGAARVTDGDGDINAGAIFVTFLNANGTVKSFQKITDGFGGMSGTLATSSWFGYGIQSLGDLDNDGTIDLAVGAPNLDEGYVYIIFLNPNGTVKATQKIGEGEGGFTGNLSPGDWWGVDVDTPGDLNGDGVEDLVVGSRGTDEIWVLFLNPNGTVNFSQRIATGVGGFTGVLSGNDNFGFGVSVPGDIDGDGITEIMVGARLDDDGGTDRGAIWVLFMNMNGTVKYHQKISDTQGGFTAVMNDIYRLGSSLGRIGDLNGDGKTEQVVGSRGNNQKGNINVLFMRTNVVLPVELIAFDVFIDEDVVSLTWETASEDNNAGFEVDAYNETTALWETLTFIEGAGTVAIPTQYRYDLRDAAQRYTKYRLKQIDFDGAVTIGPEVEVVHELPGPYILSDAYPNPFNPTTNFTLTLAASQNVDILLYDMMGRVVKPVQSGQLSANTVHHFQVDASGLPSGNYFYRVVGDVFEDSRRVVLMK